LKKVRVMGQQLSLRQLTGKDDVKGKSKNKHKSKPKKND